MVPHHVAGIHRTHLWKFIQVPRIPTERLVIRITDILHGAKTHSRVQYMTLNN
jgi:hypothetical protein